MHRLAGDGFAFIVRVARPAQFFVTSVGISCVFKQFRDFFGHGVGFGPGDKTTLIVPKGIVPKESERPPAAFQRAKTNSNWFLDLAQISL